MFYCYYPPTKLRKGNVFTGVLSFCWGGVGREGGTHVTITNDALYRASSVPALSVPTSRGETRGPSISDIWWPFLGGLFTQTIHWTSLYSPSPHTSTVIWWPRTVGKLAEHILLEWFLASHIFSSFPTIFLIILQCHVLILYLVGGDEEQLYFVGTLRRETDGPLSFLI